MEDTIIELINNQCSFEEIKDSFLLNEKYIDLSSQEYFDSFLYSAINHSTDMRLITFLISKGAVINPEGWGSPLMTTVEMLESPSDDLDESAVEFYINVMKLLFEHGAKPYTEDTNILSSLCDSDRVETSGKKRETDLRILNLFVQYGYDFNVQNFLNETFLHDCSVEEDLHMIKFALEHGANPNITNKSGDTPLQSGSYHMTLELAILYVNNGCNINNCNKDKQTFLHQIVTNYQMDDIVEFILSFNPDLTIKDENNKRALDYVYEEIVLDCLIDNSSLTRVKELLLKAGSTSTYTEENYQIFIPVINENNGNRNVDDKKTYEKIKNLLENGADVNITKDSGANVTPLYLAVKRNEIKLVKFLLEKGAKTDVYELNNGLTPLHQSVKNDNYEITKLLLDFGVNPNIMSKYDAVPFESIQSTEVLELLLKYGAQANPYYAQMDILEDSNLKVLEVLFNNGADINMIYGEDKLLFNLITSATSDDIKIKKITFLLQHGLDLNRQDAEGLSIAHYTAKQGSIRLLKFIYDQGVDLTLLNEQGESILFDAAKFGHFEAVEFFLEKGLNPNIIDEYGATALYEAGRGENVDIENLLISYGASKEYLYSNSEIVKGNIDYM